MMTSLDPPSTIGLNDVAAEVGSTAMATTMLGLSAMTVWMLFAWVPASKSACVLATTLMPRRSNSALAPRSTAATM